MKEFDFRPDGRITLKVWTYLIDLGLRETLWIVDAEYMDSYSKVTFEEWVK